MRICVLVIILKVASLYWCVSDHARNMSLHRSGCKRVGYVSEGLQSMKPRFALAHLSILRAHMSDHTIDYVLVSAQNYELVHMPMKLSWLTKR